MLLQEVDENVRRIRSNAGLFQRFPEVPAVTEWSSALSLPGLDDFGELLGQDMVDTAACQSLGFDFSSLAFITAALLKSIAKNVEGCRGQGRPTPSLAMRSCGCSCSVQMPFGTQFSSCSGRATQARQSLRNLCFPIRLSSKWVDFPSFQMDSVISSVECMMQSSWTICETCVFLQKIRTRFRASTMV